MATRAAAVVHSDPKILGGTPVFFGTRVPVQVLFDCLEAGDSLERFLEQAHAALEQARAALMASARTSRRADARRPWRGAEDA